MSCLHIMITHVAHIIAHIVQHSGTYMYGSSIHIIVVISHRLSLQNITIVHQNKIVAIHLTLFLHVRRNAGQTSSHLLVLYKIIGEVASVHVARLYKFQCDGFLIIRGFQMPLAHTE